MDKKLVGIVIPLSTRKNLSKSEKISLKHLEYYLGQHDKIFIAPECLEFRYEGIPIERFDDKYFGSTSSHNRLLLSKEFYKTFSGYKYLLIYHLDSLVLSHDLVEWCKLEYDYIGAPWIQGHDLPWLNENGVGNGGFSLRKVESFLRLLDSGVPWESITVKFQKFKETASVREFMVNTKSLLKYCIPGLNTIQKHIEMHINNGRNEDRFIYYYAQKYYPEFKIAPVDVALQFAFEANPRICYEQNKREMPFGCHAWEKYDKEFWKPYLLDGE